MSRYADCAVRPFAEWLGRCDRCGTVLTGRQTRWCGPNCREGDLAEHYWSEARRNALRRDDWACVTCGSQTALEVNHIEPRDGRGYGTGCWNHLSNLETLCHDCHVTVTNQQAVARRAA